LELGKALIAELNLDPGVDTLGRWMAHHVARLILDAEARPEGEDRRAKESQAADAIITLWRHRSQYENRANPLFELKPVIQVIRTLDPNQNVWITRAGQHRSDTVRLVYDTFRRLAICLLLRQLPTLDRVANAVASAKRTSKFQERDEREFVSVLDLWLNDAQRAGSWGKRPPGDLGDQPDQSRDALAESIVAEARAALNRLSSELAQAAGQPKKKRGRA